MHRIPLRILGYFHAKTFPLNPILQIDKPIVLFQFFLKLEILLHNFAPNPDFFLFEWRSVFIQTAYKLQIFIHFFP